MMTFSLPRYFLAFGAGLALSGAAMAQDISVAVVGPMTGSEASFGQQFKNGADLAIADINAGGGVLGKKLKLEVGDDACDPKQAVSVAEKMAGMRIPFVVGHFCSSTSIPASDAYAEGNVLQITPGSTNPQFTERGLWNTFRVCGRDDQQGMVAANYIIKNYKTKNVAIIHDKTTYGKGLADETRGAINAAGVKEKLYEAYTKGDKDFAALVSRFKKEAIDFVYIGGYYAEAALILRQDHGRQEGRSSDQGRKLGHRAWQDQLHTEGRHHLDRLCRVQARQGRQLRRIAGWSMIAGCDIGTPP